MLYTRTGTYFQILYKVVKDSKTFRVFAILNVDEGSNFGGLDITRLSRTSCLPPTVHTHLKSNVIIADADLKFLFPYNVLLRPIGVVFPNIQDFREIQIDKRARQRTLLSRSPRLSV